MSSKKEEERLIVLKNDNFRLWRWALTNQLATRKCAYILDVDSPQNANWNQHQAEGKAMIQKVLEHDDLIYVMDCPTVKAMVQKLERRYSRGMTNYQLNQNFADLKWSRTDSADKFISKLNNIKEQFTSRGIPVDQTRFIQKIISEIPSFLNDLKFDFQRRLNRNEDLEYENVCEEIVLSYDQRTRDHHKALSANTRTNSSVTNKNNKTWKNKTGKYCKYHKSHTHSTEECNKLKSKMNNSDQNKPSNQQIAVNNQASNINSSSNNTNPSSSSNNDSSSNNNKKTNRSNSSNQTSNPVATQPREIPDIFRASMAFVIENPIDIVFDTAATRHMTPNKEHFSNLQMITDGPLVLTGNGLVRAEGIGTVVIQSFNGKQWIDLNLTDVYLVPTLNDFLFSEPVCGLARVDVITNNSKGELKLIYNEQVLFTGNRNPDKIEPFKMNIKIIQKPELANVAVVSKLTHFRTGHCPYSDFKRDN